ncbi:ParB N-terminal domain-containing protein [Mycobacterium tuberculosis]|uniref:ParB N-terminal domain-containing protein n=1 Tax=Mycobacterium tuberculosis TaxID=1773 RepID=UPI0004AE74E8|nr:ParB N-terminal domain-containing protein [Mycobacterium tuberculosis]
MLQPIGVTPDRRLVFGQRRLEAARLLGWERIPVHVCHTIADVVDRAKAAPKTRFARISPPRSCSPLVAGSPSWNGRKPNSGNAKAATMAARLDILA